MQPTNSNAGGLLVAFYCTQFFLAQGNMIISLISRNIAGRTKKGICISMTFVGWAAGNMAAPQIFQTSDAPYYLHGFIAHLCIYGVYILLVILTRIVLMRRNIQKRKNAAAMITAGTHNTQSGEKIAANDHVSHDLAFQDLTDIENPNFRYVY